ncbi:MAG TPA: LLM class flavin-dependent oxidoreductase, partial [bacterium]|nr:LLM class flavin-dependent oxidoreductase [bacterium]
PTYRPVLELHGWSDIGERLSQCAARGQWQQMPSLVTDEMLEASAVWGSPAEVAARLRTEYTGLIDRLGVYEALVPGRRTEVWRSLLSGVRAPG